MVASAMNQEVKLGGKSDVRAFFRTAGMKELDLPGKAVAWYCLSGPQTTGPGLFMLVPEQAQRDLDISAEDWSFYLELVVQEMGWRWDAKLNILWITDWFAWQAVAGKKELTTALGELSLLPATPWLAELAAQTPSQLSPTLQALWTNWFFPAPPTEATPETSTVEVDEPSHITPEMIPEIIRLWFRPRTPSYIQRLVDTALRFHLASLQNLSSTPNSSPPLPDRLETTTSN